MPCIPLDATVNGQRVTGIVCTRRGPPRRCTCRDPVRCLQLASHFCDVKKRNGSGDCNRGMCETHRTVVEGVGDVCPMHKASVMKRAAKAKRDDDAQQLQQQLQRSLF